eukprot:Protomagalhaensia_wolfi_Nauph_80__252@NODE_1142_length_1701_cov_8_526474_g872_i0_p2_GENE_NODE_1142_length_1701_cov_8_526474_g872_i0NODE_1142_length_1701_cov_8_526474_g872_i0_p2_ORF_typecomplete_len121_score23_99_NODE_1142_length_1701_cov_8_526474_g872_i03365
MKQPLNRSSNESAADQLTTQVTQQQVNRKIKLAGSESPTSLPRATLEFAAAAAPGLMSARGNNSLASFKPLVLKPHVQQQGPATHYVSLAPRKPQQRPKSASKKRTPSRKKEGSSCQCRC